MKKILCLIIILTISSLNAFSLKENLIKGKVGDYVVTEQGGTLSVLLIRSLTSNYLILEEIDAPALQWDLKQGTWKDWISQDAPGHTAWMTYLINLKTNELEECYSHSQGVWLPAKDPHHFLPRLLTLSLQKTPLSNRKKIGPPPSAGEDDRRSIWNPSVIIEGKKIDKPSITAWTTKWPTDGSLISECEIELYFATLTFPVWIEVKSPHYKVSLRAVDAGHTMLSPRPLVFLQSPLILGPAIFKKDQLELLVHCPPYYSSLKLLAVDLSHPDHPLTEIIQSPELKSLQTTLSIPEKILENNLVRGHRYRWVLVPIAYPELVIYSDQVFQW